MARKNTNTITGVEKGYINEYCAILHILSKANGKTPREVHSLIDIDGDNIYYEEEGQVSFFGTSCVQGVVSEFDNFFDGNVSNATLEVYKNSLNFWSNYILPDFDSVVSDGGDPSNKGDIVLYKEDKIVSSLSLKYKEGSSVNHQGCGVDSIVKHFGQVGDITEAASKFDKFSKEWRTTPFDAERGEIEEGTDLDFARIDMLNEYNLLLNTFGNNVKVASTSDIIRHYFDLASGGEKNLTQIVIRPKGNHTVKAFDDDLRALLTKRIESGPFRFYSVWSESGKTSDFYVTNDQYTIKVKSTAHTQSHASGGRILRRNSYVNFIY